MENRLVRVRIPASSANLGPGFDAVGMAFQLYTTITMCVSEKTEIRLAGSEVAGLPTDKSNLLYQVAAYLFREAGLPVPELTIEVDNEIPLTRGLGSSAAAIVGALAGANVLAGEPFSRDQLFSMASHWEGHPDNVGASLFGGIVVAAMPEETEASKLVPYVRIPTPEGLETLVVIPDYHLSTNIARSTLPTTYEKADVIYNVGRSSLLVAALAQGRLDLLAQAMRDRLHQPYRIPLVPGLEEILAKAVEHGALGAALSGAGPTILCFFNREEAKNRLLDFVEQVMSSRRIVYKAMILKPDMDGVKIDVARVPDA